MTSEVTKSDFTALLLSRPLMQTAPPSRIMLGGAALNPDSEIPRQLSVCRGAIRFNGEAIAAVLVVGLAELDRDSLWIDADVRLSEIIRRVQTNKSAKIVKIPICAASQQMGRTPGGAKA
jgi:hypothetical protein